MVVDEIDSWVSYFRIRISIRIIRLRCWDMIEPFHDESNMWTISTAASPIRRWAWRWVSCRESYSCIRSFEFGRTPLLNLWSLPAITITNIWYLQYKGLVPLWLVRLLGCICSCDDLSINQYVAVWSWSPEWPVPQQFERICTWIFSGPLSSSFRINGSENSLSRTAISLVRCAEITSWLSDPRRSHCLIWSTFQFDGSPCLLWRAGGVASRHYLGSSESDEKAWL